MAVNTCRLYLETVTNRTARKRKTPRTLNAEQAEVCRRLRELWDQRKDLLGLTQESVASAMKKRNADDGITQGAIGHFLTGRKAVPIDRIFWFAELLRVHPLEIDPRLRERLPPLLADALAHMAPTAVLHRSANYAASYSKSLTVHER